MEKFHVELSRNNGKFGRQGSPESLPEAKAYYNGHVRWYSASYQRIDTAFTLRLVNSNTGEVVSEEVLPITTIDEIKSLNKELEKN